MSSGWEGRGIWRIRTSADAIVLWSKVARFTAVVIVVVFVV
jgi:hypothetical protein